MAAIAALTNRAILLRKGGVQYSGPPKEAFDLYMTDDTPTAEIYSAPPNPDRPNITRVEIETSQAAFTHESGQPWRVRFELHFPYALPKASLWFQIFNQFQTAVLRFDAYDKNVPICQGAGKSVVTCTIPHLDLNVGSYHLKVRLAGPPGGLRYETLEDICPFTVVILDRVTAHGWKPESCSYLVDADWDVK
jgi:lipopolysaccharide transport system ATP-binding protein